MNIVLTGFMASGKTVVGKKLAQTLKMKYIDVDEQIEKDTRLSISDIFEKQGETAFRDLETKAVCCVAMLDNYVIATGGGVVLRLENIMELRKNGRIIYLSADPETILKRVGKAQTRPLLAREKDKLGVIKNLLESREPLYKNCDFQVETAGLNVEEVVAKIRSYLGL